MTLLPAEAIERARAARIEDEVERRRIALMGRIERVGPCPICGGTDRFAVHTRRQLWNCRGCGIGGGDAISLVMHLDGVDFPHRCRDARRWRVAALGT